MNAWLSRASAVILFFAASLTARPCQAAEELPLFSRGLMEDIDEDYVPKESEWLKEVALCALRGEYEPFTFAVHDDGKGGLEITASMTDFLEEKDAKKVIAANCIEIRGLKKGAKFASGATEDWTLDQAGKAAAAPGKTARFWITVHAPKDAASGIYRSTLRVLAGERSAEIPVTLRVSKAVLQPAPGVRFYLLSTISPYGQYYGALKPEESARLKPRVVEFYRELREHGMTGFCPKTNDWPYKDGDISGLEAEVEAALEAGLDGPIVWGMYPLIDASKGGDQYDFNGRMDKWDEKKDLARLTEICKLAGRKAKEKKWPEIIYYVEDEPGTQFEDRTFLLRSMDILEKTSRTLKELGARSHSTITEPVDEKHNAAPRWSKTPDEMRALWDKCRPFLGIRNYGYGYPGGKTNLDNEMADAKKCNAEVWIYNNDAAMGTNRYCARMYFGLWGWKARVNGLTAWTYPGGRTAQFEMIREGIDDYNAIAALEKLVEGGAGSEKDREEAKKLLASLSAAIKLNDDGFITDWTQAAKKETPGADWKLADFQGFKFRVVEALDKLSK